MGVPSSSWTSDRPKVKCSNSLHSGPHVQPPPQVHHRSIVIVHPLGNTHSRAIQRQIHIVTWSRSNPIHTRLLPQLASSPGLCPARCRPSGEGLESIQVRIRKILTDFFGLRCATGCHHPHALQLLGRIKHQLGNDRMIVVGGGLHEVFRTCVFLYPIGDPPYSCPWFRVFDHASYLLMVKAQR